MNNANQTPGPRRKIAVVAAVIGGIFGVLGLAAGLYFGLVRHLLHSKTEIQFPPGLLAGSIALVVTLLAWGGFHLWRRFARRKPAGLDENW